MITYSPKKHIPSPGSATGGSWQDQQANEHSAARQTLRFPASRWHCLESPVSTSSPVIGKQYNYKCNYNYTTLHNTTLHYTALITLHYATATTTTAAATTQRYANYTTLHYNYNYTTLRYTRLDYTILYQTTVHNATVHHNTKH